ncbi:MAG: DUF6653 family protein [Pseudomonadota bacterium]
MTSSFSERLMGMSDEVWARHANPLSVWTRVPVIAFLTVALWSRYWIGSWAVPAVGLVVLWIWLNPRVFPRPSTLESWGTKGVLGERIWLARSDRPIPMGFARQAILGNSVAGMGGLLWLYGVVMLDPWATGTGLGFTLLGKMWFLDRMVWLYETTAREAPENLPPDPRTPSISL